MATSLLNRSETQQIVEFSTVIQLAVLSGVLIHIPVFSPAVGLIYVSFIPGIVVMAIVGIDLNRVESVLYALLISHGLVTLIEILSVYAYIEYQAFPQPFKERTLILLLSGVVLVLILVLHYSGTESELPNVEMMWANRKSGDIRIIAIATVLVVLAALTAYLVNHHRFSAPYIGLTLLISVVPLVCLSGEFSRSAQTYLVWACGTSLVLANRLFISNFAPWGDAGFEYYFANLTLINGFWDPGMEATKGALTQLTLIIPTYSMVAHLPLIHVFKVFYPLLFGLFPATLFLIYKRQFSSRTAILGVFFYIFLHPFFTNLSRNSRTGFSLLFISVLVLVLLDNQLSQPHRVLLIVLSLFQTIVSHYGTSYLFLFIVGGAYIVYLSLQVIDRYSGLINIHEKIWRFQLKGTLILIFGILSITWFYHTTDSFTFAYLINSTFLLGKRLFEFALFSNTQATQALTSPTFSFTRRFIRIEYIVLTVGSMLGFVFVAYRTLNIQVFTDRDFLQGSPDYTVHMTYFILSVTAMGLLAGLFLPSKAFGIGRVYMITAMFSAPYFVIGVGTIVQGANEWSASVILGILLIAFLMVNSGGVAASVTQDPSFQPNLQRERILTNGTQIETHQLFLRYTSDKDTRAVKWLMAKKTDEQILSSGLREWNPSYQYYRKFDPTEPPGPFHPLTNESLGDAGYVYLSEPVVRTNRIMPTYYPRFQEFEYISLHTVKQQLQRNNGLYDNGYSKIYHNSDNDT